MESYHKRKRLLEEKCGKLIHVKPFNDDIGIVDTRQQKYIKQLQDISDEEGLRLAYETKMVYISTIILFVAGTKDPIDMVGDLKLPFGDTFKKHYKRKSSR